MLLAKLIKNSVGVGASLISLTSAQIYFIPGAEAFVIFQDNFDSGASFLWGNENGNWSASGGVYDAQYPNNNPATYSSLPFDLKDFAVDLDINRVQDGGIFLRSSRNSNGISGVLLVTGGEGKTGTGLYWHIVTNNQYGPAFNPVSGLFQSGVSNIHLRVEVKGDTYSAFLNRSNTLVTTLTTNMFSQGRVALYDYSGQTFDNLVIESTPVPEPSTILGLGLLGFGAFCQRKLSQGKKSKQDN